MPDTGWVLAGLGQSDPTVGTVAWANPNNITVDDGSYAEIGDLPKDAQSEYIKGSSFGLALPSNTIIEGIEFRGVFSDQIVATQCAITHAVIAHPTLGFLVDQEPSGQVITNTPQTYVYGGASELHGASWLPADVNSAALAAAFSLNAEQSFPTSLPRCLTIWIRVHYRLVLTPARSRSFWIT